MKSNKHSQNKGGTAHNAIVVGVGGANGHALRDVMQGNGTGHYHPGHQQRKFIVLLAAMEAVVVAVDQLVQIIRRFGVVLVDVRHLGVSLAVDEVIQKIGDGNTHRNGGDHRQNTGSRLKGFGHQIKTHHAQHHAAGKAQQKTDSSVGVFLKHGAYQTAKAGPRHARNGCGRDQCGNYSHKYVSFFLQGRPSY